MPCDHFSLHVPLSKLEAVVSFLLTSLSHISFKEFVRPVPSVVGRTVVGMGDGRPYLWIVGVPEEDGVGPVLERVLREFNTHMAFSVESVFSFSSPLPP
jgi:hypothetical protein